MLVIIDSMTAGGAEMLLTDFSAGAPEADLRISVAYLADIGAGSAAARMRKSGIEPVRIDCRGLLHPSSYAAVRDHIRMVGPDLVHTHLDYADAIGGLAARSLGIPSVSTVHVMEWQLGTFRDRVRQRLLRAARRHSAWVVVAVSEASREAMIAAGLERPERIVTIRNGVDARSQPGAGRAIRQEFGIGPDELVVSQIAVLRRGKGHAVAADAVAELSATGLHARLLVVGDGPDRSAVERAIEPLGGAAIMTGHREDVMAILDASDVVVAPSRIDAFPTVLLEAMAAGVPTVATAVGGIPEIVVDGETGLLVSPTAAAAGLAAALREVLDNEDLRGRLGNAARDRYEDEFTAAKWARRTASLYRRVLASRDDDGRVVRG